MTYLWIKAFHLIAIVTWFAAIFYLPRLFVYHAMTEDRPGLERFKIMERKLYNGIMTPSMLAVVGSGLGMLAMRPFLLEWTWMQIKLTLIVALVGYHFWCAHLMRQFRDNANTRSHVWYRYFNEVPTVILIAVVILAVLKRPL
jgi:protoporphyrinogen IX oxidase